MTGISGIARLFGGKLGERFTYHELLNKFDTILNQEQKLIAKDQIYNSSVDRKFLIIFLCVTVAFFALCLLSNKSLKENIQTLKDNQDNQNANQNLNCNSFKRKFFEYTPEIIIAIPVIAVLSLCVMRFCNPFTYQSYFNNLYVQSDLLNLSSDQIEQINKVVDKENLLAKIVLPIFALCVLAIAIGIITYMNAGPDYKIEHDSSSEQKTQNQLQNQNQN
jgi:hypothetical protein